MPRIPAIFHALFSVSFEIKSEDQELVLLRDPEDKGFYEFSAKDDLVLTNRYPGFTPAEIKKSFHADTYCFDSAPEKECFMQYITSEKVQEVYFTGMFEVFRDYPDVLNLEEMSELLQISTKTGRKLLSSGKIRSFRIGRNYRIPKRNLISFVFDSPTDVLC